MSGERCHNCDRLLATPAQLAAQARNGAADGDVVCYGANALRLCGPEHRVDWRARALAAERDLAATEAEARTALDEMHRRVEAAEAELDAARSELAHVVAVAWEVSSQESPRVPTREEWNALRPAERTVRSAVGSWRDLAEKRGREMAAETERDAAATEKIVAAAESIAAERDALRAAVQRHREAVKREQNEATTRAELFAVADECHAPLTVREPATQAERNLATASGLLGAALVCLAAEQAYRETEGRPWAERIAAKAKADEARATLARMMGGE